MFQKNSTTERIRHYSKPNSSSLKKLSAQVFSALEGYKSTPLRGISYGLLLCLTLGCSDQGNLRQASPQQQADSPSESLAQAAPEAETEPTLETPSGHPPVTTEQESTHPQVTDSESAASVDVEVTPEAPHVPPDIFVMMASTDWQLESDRDLADYLPVPLGSEGQVGRFIRDTEILSLARVTYPAEVFANPHEAWIRERMALLPDAHERVVRDGPTVIHIVAEQARSADEVAALFSPTSGAADND